MPQPDEGAYSVWTARWAGGLAAEVSGRGHALRADEPPEFGGDDSGPMPTEILTAALASCFCMSLVWAAGRRGVALGNSLEVDVQAERAPGKSRHGAYDITVRSALPADVLEPLVELAQRVCWVSNTLQHPPELRYQIE